MVSLRNFGMLVFCRVGFYSKKVLRSAKILFLGCRISRTLNFKCLGKASRF